MRPEIREHLNRADEFLHAAEILASEQLHAIAIGRAYYAIFHAAIAALMAQGIERKSHHAIIAAFGQFIVKPGLVSRDLQAYFQDAFDVRGEGDYGPDPTATADQAQTHIERGREFVRVCRDLCSGDT